MKLLLILLVLAALIAVNFVAARMLVDRSIRFWKVVSGIFLARMVGRLAEMGYKAAASQPDPIVNDVVAFTCATFTVLFFYRKVVKAEMGPSLMATGVYVLSMVIALLGLSFITTP